MATQEYLLFVSKPTGYELQEREGDLPAIGTRVDDVEPVLEITKVGPSPLPGDPRRCAYGQPVP
jgi:hypothetical protein